MASKELLPGTGVYAKLEVDFSSNWNATSLSFTDVTADVRFQDGFSWERGRNQAWDQLSPGSFGFTLNNRAGDYDPASNSGMVGSRPTKLTLYYPNPTTTAYVQFLGVVDQWDVDYPSFGRDQVVHATAVDWLTSLWLTKVVTFSTLGSTSTAAYQAICNAAGIPSAYQSFTSGTFSLKPAAFFNTDCLSALSLVSNSQRQFLYVSKTGVITSVDLTSGSVAQTYDDTDVDYPYSGLKGGVGGSGSYTIVQLQQPGSVKVQGGGTDNTAVTANIAGTPLPKTKFGPQVLVINASPVTNPTGLVSSWAGAVPTPATYWWRELEIKPLKAPATLVPAVLGAELGQRITVVQHPLEGGSVSKSASVRSIKHSFAGGDWTVTFGLTNR